MADAFTLLQAWADLIELADDVGFLPTPPGGQWSKRWGWEQRRTDEFFEGLKEYGHVFMSTGKSGHVGFRIAFQVSDNHDGEFERVWEIYPKQVARSKAFGAYSATRKGRRGKHNHPPVSARELHEATKRFADARQGEEEEFILNPSTFFGPDQRWKEKHQPRTNNETKGSRSQWKRPTSKDLTKTRGTPTTGRSPTVKKSPKKKKSPLKDPLENL